MGLNEFVGKDVLYLNEVSHGYLKYIFDVGNYSKLVYSFNHFDVDDMHKVYLDATLRKGMLD